MTNINDLIENAKLQRDQALEEVVEIKSEELINSCHISELEAECIGEEWNLIVAITERMAARKILQESEEDEAERQYEHRQNRYED